MDIDLYANPADAAAMQSHATLSVAGERDLIDRARRDAHAFGQLYRLHAPPIANYLQRRTGDAHAAEDLLSETFLAAMKGLPRFRCNGTPLRFWLYRLATNAANRWMRTHERRHRRERETSRAIDAPTVPCDEHALAPYTTHALAQLNPSHQSVLVLHVVEGLTLEQIALVLDCRVGTVKSRLSRARDAFRIAMQRMQSTTRPTD
jgi:RNA polymerase sigma factor (sigma-70 family)